MVARDSASGEDWDTGAEAGRRSSVTVSCGFPAGQDGVDAARRPGQFVLQHGVGARAGLTHSVLDVGQRAHGELQAAREIGAVAVAQRDAPAHDVVAEPFARGPIHAGIMAHESGKVEPPCLFVSGFRPK